MEVLARREERERRMGNGTAGRLISSHHPGCQIEDLGEDTDNDSISTFASESHTDEDTHDESNVSIFAPESDTDEDINDDSNINSWPNMLFRYMAIVRVPWLNRRSRRDEWGFHCVGCEDLYEWPNHARRDFIMSTFRVHLKECGPIKDGVHHLNDCCKKGTCKKKKDRFPDILDGDGPFWRC
jgi:hypothetical protein